MADSPHDSEREDEQQTVIDLSKLKRYFRKISLTFFDEDDFVATEKPLDAALSDPAYSEVIKRFVGDSQTRALVIRGIANKGNMNDYCTLRHW